MSSASKTIVITGANRGIGLELARIYASRADRVIGVCRTPSAELAKLGTRVVAGVDVTEDSDVARLASELEGERIDVLINNAGLLVGDRLASVDFEAVRRQFEVNAVAPLRVSRALAPRIVDGGKLAIVTSRMGSMADNGSGGQYGYRMSKAAVNAAGKSLSIDLAPRGIAVVLLHPGYVQTEMTGGNGDVTPAVAAKGLAARVDELTMKDTGCFVHANGERLPW